MTKVTHTRLEVYDGENSMWATDKPLFRYSIHWGNVSCYYGRDIFWLWLCAWIDFRYQWLFKFIPNKYVKKLRNL